MQLNNSSFRSALISMLLVLLGSTTSFAQTTLGAGDIAFTLLNMEGNNQDAFGFVLLTDVTAGTSIKLTDAEYTTGLGFNAADEGVLNIAFTNAFACGTEIIFTDANSEPAIYDFQATTAGVTTTVLSGEFSLTTAGETPILFQSENLTNPPADAFITALANTGVGFGETATGSGDLPPGLTLGTSAMVMTPNVDAEWDNIKYDCSTTENLPDALRTALFDPANWLKDNDNPLPTTACNPTFSCAEPCMDPEVNFTLADATFCEDEEPSATLGGGSPEGGSYSGPGVVDNSNGSTFTFTPSDAGLGAHTVTYSYTAPDGCSNSAEVVITVVAPPTVTMSTTGPYNVNSSTVNLEGGGTPTGGVYSGPGVTDGVNGIFYDFDPGEAGVGMHMVTYTVTDANGCTGSTSITVEVFEIPVSPIADINGTDENGLPLMNGQTVAVQGVVHCIDFDPSTALEFWIMEPGGDGISLFRSATTSGYIVTEGDEILAEGEISSFNGLLEVLPDYIEVLSQGNSLNTPLAVTEVNESTESKYIALEDAVVSPSEVLMSSGGDFFFNVETIGGNQVTVWVDEQTGISETFLMEFLVNASGLTPVTPQITGIGSQSDTSSPFTEGYRIWPCSEDDFMLIVGVDEPAWSAELRLAPNPTRDQLRINSSITLDAYRLYNLQGQLLQNGLIEATNLELSLDQLPSGVYQLQLISGNEMVSRRVVRQ